MYVGPLKAPAAACASCMAAQKLRTQVSSAAQLLASLGPSVFLQQRPCPMQLSTCKEKRALLGKDTLCLLATCGCTLVGGFSCKHPCILHSLQSIQRTPSFSQASSSLYAIFQCLHLHSDHHLLCCVCLLMCSGAEAAGSSSNGFRSSWNPGLVKDCLDVLITSINVEASNGYPDTKVLA